MRCVYNPTAQSMSRKFVLLLPKSRAAGAFTKKRIHQKGVIPRRSRLALRRPANKRPHLQRPQRQPMEFEFAYPWMLICVEYSKSACSRPHFLVICIVQPSCSTALLLRQRHLREGS